VEENTMPKLKGPLLEDPYILRTDRGEFYWYETARGHIKRLFFTLARPVLAWMRQRDEQRRLRQRVAMGELNEDYSERFE